MSRRPGARRRPGPGAGALALNAAIVSLALATALLLVSALYRAAWPERGAGPRRSAQRAEAPASGANLGFGPAVEGELRSREGEEPGHRSGSGGAGEPGGRVEPGGGAPPRAGRAGSEIRVQVLNGCGVMGAGSSLASVLRRAGGIDVVEIGNADSSEFESTVVVDRTGHGAVARRVAEALGGAPVVKQRTADGRFDVMVIVGYDRGRWLERPAGE